MYVFGWLTEDYNQLICMVVNYLHEAKQLELSTQLTRVLLIVDGNQSCGWSYSKCSYIPVRPDYLGRLFASLPKFVLPSAHRGFVGLWTVSAQRGFNALIHP